jgi:HTH-type transcriptional repressor of NAD biosynthesis genes
MRPHSHALIVGKFAPLHHGHQLLLDAASHASGELTVVVWSNPDFTEMPNETRAAWIRALYPDARVIVAGDGPANDAPDVDHRTYVASLLEQHAVRPDVVYSSEAYGPGFAAHLGADHIAVDPARVTVRVSGTSVRADVHASRRLLDPLVYAHFVEKVVFLGAESTGKSALAAAAADAWATAYVPEYGRTYYEERGGELDLEDYVHIARRHREIEDAAAQRANRYLFVDTNAVTTMFFSHYYNRDSLPELRALAAECAARYEHVIVCDDDIVFEQDGWRDNIDWRARMQGMVLHDLAVRGIDYATVSGSIEQRLAQLRTILAVGTVQAPPAITSLGPRPIEAR